MTAADPETWDRFVEAGDPGSYLQLSGWAAVKAVNGWTAHRLVTDEPAGAGAQILVRRPRPMPWGFAYAPRGPVGDLGDPALRDALVDGLRSLGRHERIGRVRVDPETTDAEPYGAALLTDPWRPAPKVQPPTTRLIDLTADRDHLWSDLGRKHRQYISKAAREGVVIEQLDAGAGEAATSDALAEFDRIYRRTGARAGFAVRIPDYYSRVWAAFGVGIVSTVSALKATVGFGAISLGPWVAFPDAQTENTDPYAKAHRARAGKLTGRAVVTHEAHVNLGLGAEVAARITEECFYSLEAPVLRVGGFDTPYPPSRIEEDYLPDLDRLLDAVDRTLDF